MTDRRTLGWLKLICLVSAGTVAVAAGGALGGEIILARHRGEAPRLPLWRRVSPCA